MRFRPAPVPSPTCTAITAVRRAVAIAFRSFEIWSKGRSASSRSPVPPSRLPEASIFPALGGRRLPRRRLHQIGGDLAEPVTFRRKAPHLQRSEEHTSELQSRENLVCRLLLEKKKTER